MNKKSLGIACPREDRVASATRRAGRDIQAEGAEGRRQVMEEATRGDREARRFSGSNAFSSNIIGRKRRRCERVEEREGDRYRCSRKQVEVQHG